MTKPVFVIVNEVGINGQRREVREMWTNWRLLMERCAEKDRVSVLAVSMAGDRVAIRADDAVDAEGLLSMLLWFGIPRGLIRLTTRQPAGVLPPAVEVRN